MPQFLQMAVNLGAYMRLACNLFKSFRHGMSTSFPLAVYQEKNTKVKVLWRLLTPTRVVVIGNSAEDCLFCMFGVVMARPVREARRGGLGREARAGGRSQKLAPRQKAALLQLLPQGPMAHG